MTKEDRKMVAYLKDEYPVGTRIRLIQMQDQYHPVLPGTEGIVRLVDDLGTIHMKWSNGSSLGLVYGEDKFEKIKERKPLSEETEIVIEAHPRYGSFVMFDEPTAFKEAFAGKDAEVVQLHSVQTYNIEDGKEIIGFCGQCKWENNVLTSLDHDSYSSDMTVYGYSWWENEEKGIKTGLDILVGENW